MANRRVRPLEVRVADLQEKLRRAETQKKIRELKASMGVKRRRPRR